MRTSVKVGMGLGQIGEFSFIIASLGLSLSVTSDFYIPLSLLFRRLRLFSTPYLIRNSDKGYDLLDKITPESVTQDDGSL
ncbi:MAG: hypothetical protein IPG09_18600 [Ignavibacteria bacterium]|nr:hypothetical protein [Ignavibacteria bacterium]